MANEPDICPKEVPVEQSNQGTMDRLMRGVEVGLELQAELSGKLSEDV